MIVTAKVLARQQRQKSMNSSLKIRHQDKAAHIGIPHIFNLSAIGGWKKRHRPINRMKSIIITVEKKQGKRILLRTWSGIDFDFGRLETCY